ncbi:MAG: metallophosphoesterase [Tenericutes bacterium]|nr:metallophosphoesterase [Mycoplasmatota bacterium]
MKKILASFLLLLALFFVVSCDNVTTISTTSIVTTSSSVIITTTESLSTTDTTTVIETTETTTVPMTTTEAITTVATTEPVTTLTTTVPYVDTDPPFILQMQHDTIKILQLTDLHLKYTSDDTATQTLNLITKLIDSDDFDLVVITGDMTLSQVGPAYFLDLIEVMEACLTPWTFVFGNHDNDYNDYQEFIDVIPVTQYLYFRVGPDLEGGGYGNFVIQFQKDFVPFYDFIFMDSHAERDVYTAAEGAYDYIKEAQVAWYEERVSHSPVNNLVFFHIPLRQYMYNDGYIGEFNEYVCPQGRDTGLYDAFVLYNKTKGLFVGHDHVNDFLIIRDDIILAYGRATGFGGYGELEKGGRIIEIQANKEVVTSIILESDVTD